MKVAIIMWTLILVVFYVYFGYPLLLVIISGIKRKPVKKEDITPDVSLIITAYNEEKAIGKKIENSLQLNYPKDRLEIIIASDGSTDNTNKIVREYESKFNNVKLVLNPINKGKSSIQNQAIPEAKGEIIVFSDATGIYNREAIKAIAGNFNDPAVGCVAGVVYDVKNNETSISEANNLYFKYDNFLRKKEGEMGILNGISGSIFAIRKKLYIPLDIFQADDLDTPLNVLRQGYRVVWEPEAISREEIASTLRGKFKQKVRVVIRGLTIIFCHERELLNPFKHPLISLSLISHRLLRYFAPFFLIFIFGINIFLLDIKFYRIFFAAQVLFYFLASLGGILYFKNIRVKIFSVPFYFCLLNTSAFIGVLNFISGKRRAKWKPER